MSYDQELAERVRREFRGRHDVLEKKMFGGVGFLLSGNMCVGIWKESLIARVGPEAYQEALEMPHVSEFDITGRPMRGWVMVDADGLDPTEAVREWVLRCVRFVVTLPEK